MGGNKADMRITSIRREDATVPNALIQSCHDSQSKRRTLAQLQRAWNRYDRRLAMYDSNDDIIGIAFADSDGNIKSVVSPHDLSKAIPVIERYVKGTIKQHRLRRQDTSQFGNMTRDDTTDASMQRDYADVFGNVGHDGTSSVPPDDDEIDADYDMPEAEPSNGTAAGVKTHDTMKPRRKRHHAIGIVILLVILAALGLSIAGALGYGPLRFVSNDITNVISNTARKAEQSIADGGKHYKQIAADKQTTVTVKNGDTIRTVVQTLKESGMPNIAEKVGTKMEDDGTSSKIQPGVYHVKGSEDADTIARRLSSGQLYPDGYFGVDNGTTIRAMASKIGNGKFSFTADDFTQAMDNPQAFKANYQMLSAIPDDLPSLEGFVPAGTYDLSACQNANDAVKVLLDAGEQRFESSGTDAATWFRVLTEASMLDKEIMYDSERQTVASIIDNRLAQDMPLQIDATVLYALGKDTGIPTIEETNVDSPYNTYKNKGLPIGPICSGISQTSMDAVTNHQATQYLYYCLAPANDGHHVFATTYDEHMKNVQAYEAATGTNGNATQTQ